MSKFVYVELEIKGFDEKIFIASRGYLNVDYIVSIPIHLKIEW